MTKNIVLKCQYCNKDYNARYEQKERSRFCSKSCVGKSLAGSKKKPKGKSVEKTCLYCNEKFIVKASRIDGSKYCSKSCKCLSNTTKKQKTCIICNKVFNVIYSRFSIAKYCSNDCYNTNRRDTAKEPRNCKTCGKSYPATKGSGKKYCSIQCFNKQKIKDGAPSFAAVRANMKKGGEITHCERCGYNEYPSILGIHHKDRNRKNNHRENLEVLCANCHSIEHLVHVCHGFKE